MPFDNTQIIDSARSYPERFFAGVDFARDYISDALEVYYGNVNVLGDAVKESMAQRASRLAVDVCLQENTPMIEAEATMFGALLEARQALKIEKVGVAV